MNLFLIAATGFGHFMRIIVTRLRFFTSMFGNAFVEFNDLLEDFCRKLFAVLSTVKPKFLLRNFVTLRYLACILNHRRSFESLRALRIAIFFGVAGFLFDSIKAAIWADWRPYQMYGPSIFQVYLECNLVAVLTVVYLRRFHMSFRWGCVFLGFSMFLSGLLNWAILLISIGEHALIPLVWHGAFGFFAGFLLASSANINDIRRAWTNVGVRHSASALDIRKELEKELQWCISSSTQAITAFVAIFGVAMTLFVTSKVKGMKEEWIPTDPDLNTTCIQLCTGLAICLVALSWWGVIRGLDALRWVKKRWLYHQ